MSTTQDFLTQIKAGNNARPGALYQPGLMITTIIDRVLIDGVLPRT